MTPASRVRDLFLIAVSLLGHLLPPAVHTPACLYIRPSSSSVPPHISMESPPGADHDDSASAAVCCMCGDRGLPGELFQCSLCRLRLQHRYCSELYPREAAYRSCNWCLRDLGGAGGSNNPPVHKTPKNPRDVSGGCSRSAFSVEGNPIKKKGAGRVTTVAAAKGVQQANNVRKPRFSRVKVRRYKLLAEVIC